MNIGEYSPMFTESEANNCFSIIFRGEYQGIKKITDYNIKTQTQLFVCMHVYVAVVLIIS